MEKILKWDFFKEATGENVYSGHETPNNIDAFDWAADYAQSLANLHQCGIGFSANEGATCYRYPKKKRGRPASGNAKTGAERIAKLRQERKQQGACPCCGQKLPRKTE